MYYYTVDLYGTPTEAKTLLTSRFQWVPEYYMGSNIGGDGGPDQYADHHIFLRTNDVDELSEVLLSIYKEHMRVPQPYLIDGGDVPFVSKCTVEDIFSNHYANDTVKPVPYTYTPIEEHFPEPFPK